MPGSAEDSSERTRQLRGPIRARGTRHPRTHEQRVLWALRADDPCSYGAEDPRPQRWRLPLIPDPEELRRGGAKWKRSNRPGQMDLELGPQASCRFRLETAQTPIPRPESYKTTPARSTLAFPAVGGASHSAARASRIGRQRAPCPASAAQNRMWSARGRACSPCAARWRSRAGLCRDRFWPSTAPRPDVHNCGAEGRLPDWRGLIGAALGLGVGACGPLKSLPSRGFRD